MEMDNLYFHVRKDGIMTKDRNNLMMKVVVKLHHFSSNISIVLNLTLKSVTTVFEHVNGVGRCECLIVRLAQKMLIFSIPKGIFSHV